MWRRSRSVGPAPPATPAPAAGPKASVREAAGGVARGRRLMGGLFRPRRSGQPALLEAGALAAAAGRLLCHFVAVASPEGPWVTRGAARAVVVAVDSRRLAQAALAIRTLRRRGEHLPIIALLEDIDATGTGRLTEVLHAQVFVHAEGADDVLHNFASEGELLVALSMSFARCVARRTAYESRSSDTLCFSELSVDLEEKPRSSLEFGVNTEPDDARGCRSQTLEFDSVLAQESWPVGGMVPSSTRPEPPTPWELRPALSPRTSRRLNLEAEERLDAVDAASKFPKLDGVWRADIAAGVGGSVDPRLREIRIHGSRALLGDGACAELCREGDGRLSLLGGELVAGSHVLARVGEDGGVVVFVRSAG